MAHTRKNLFLQQPLILAIENSGMCGSVALTSGSHCIAEQSLLSKMTHSKRLLTSVQRLMEEAEVSWEEIDALAISLGPGSFTGLRIGLSSIKGLAMATGIPLIGISSLDALACQFTHVSMPICPILDARKHEVYTALYHPDKNGLIKRTSDYLVISPQNLIKQIDGPTLFIGDGVDVYGDLLREELGQRAFFAPAQLHFARAASIAFLALPFWQKKEFVDPADVAPLYVRPSDAELNFQKKNG